MPTLAPPPLGVPVPSGTKLATGTARLTWRLIRDEPRCGARNMALDHALAACLSRAEAVVRLYGWTQPTVSFGRNEPSAGSYSVAAAAAAGIDFVRRPTGGRAVLHDRELTYAVVAPLGVWGGLRAAYARINRALAVALRSLGAPVEIARGEGVLRPDAGACFQAPASGEVSARGRKLVGSAQARLEGVLLQHGSVLLAGDQSLLDTLSGRPCRGTRPAVLGELVASSILDDLAGAIAKSLRKDFGGTWVDGSYGTEEIVAADRLEANRYALDSWTWRR